jgi:hypothetical protein
MTIVGGLRRRGENPMIHGTREACSFFTVITEGQHRSSEMFLQKAMASRSTWANGNSQNCQDRT